MLALKRSASVAPEVNLRNTLPTSEESDPPWFCYAQSRHDKKSKTGVSLAPQKGLMSLKNFFKKLVVNKMQNEEEFLRTESNILSLENALVVTLPVGVRSWHPHEVVYMVTVVTSASWSHPLLKISVTMGTDCIIALDVRTYFLLD